MTRERVDIWKLRLLALGGLLTATALTVTFCSHQEAVTRSKVDRTLGLVSLIDQPHFRKPRDAFRRFLLKLPYAQRAVTTAANKSDQMEQYEETVGQYLKLYRGPNGMSTAWNMVGPLGDYYGRLLACIQARACSVDVYCRTVNQELVIFADMTRSYRKRLSTHLARTFADDLDIEGASKRCP